MIKKLFALAFSILLLSACSSEKPFEDDSSLLSPASDPPPSIFVDSELYTFFDTAKGSRYTTKNLEYLGNVIAVTDCESNDRQGKNLEHDRWLWKPFVMPFLYPLWQHPKNCCYKAIFTSSKISSDFILFTISAHVFSA